MIDLELIAGQKLTPPRLEHTLRVADSAKELAGRYGEDKNKAITAALLHDIMKDTPREEQLYLIEKSGIILTCADLASPKIWHSIAGAAYLRGELGIADGDIFNAVYYHTTGRAGMSLLEKVIYIADYISADRTYSGVEDMRHLAHNSLEEAMLFALEFCISKLARSRQVIHPDSVACYNELLTQQAGK